MAKKLSFDNLPGAVEKILEMLKAEGSEHTALPELMQRVARLEKKIDNIERSLSPDRPTMDKHTVLRTLKLRPRALNDLMESGALPSHADGRRTVFYEDDVVRFYMNNGWKAVKEAVAKSEPVAESAFDEPAPMQIAADGRQRVDIKGACQLLGRTPASVYKCVSEKRIPFIKEGAKVSFYTDELREWAKSNPARKRRKRSEIK
jgi:excisionase family DNA binding protein